MLPAQKTKSLAALKRLSGLIRKVEELIEGDAYCPEILRNILAMKGHLEYTQARVLESHMHTCAEKKLSSKSGKKKFIDELIKVIGLSKR